MAGYSTEVLIAGIPNVGRNETEQLLLAASVGLPSFTIGFSVVRGSREMLPNEARASVVRDNENVILTITWVDTGVVLFSDFARVKNPLHVLGMFERAGSLLESEAIKLARNYFR